LKVLWLAPYAIWPPIHGGKIRAYNLARRLANLGHAVHVWCITDETEVTPEPPIQNLSIRFLKPRRRDTPQAKLAAVLSALPTPAWRLRSAEAIAAVRNARGFDVIVLEQAHCGGILPELTLLKSPWVLDSQNVEWLLTGQIGRRLRNPITRARWALDATKFKQLEGRLLREASVCVATSPQDSQRLRELVADAEIDIHPNGVDTTFFTFVDHTQPRGANLLLTGTLGYYPNLDAALWLIKEIFPLVRRELPHATVSLVGGSVTPDIRRLDDPGSGVRVVGEVPDVRPYMRDADVFVMPIRLGSGTRLKALEALASGLPVVTTRIGVEGLDLDDRQLALLGETPVELATAITQALGDSATRARLVRRGRAYVAEHFDWDRIAADFHRTLERVLR